MGGLSTLKSDIMKNRLCFEEHTEQKNKTMQSCNKGGKKNLFLKNYLTL